MTHWSSVLHTPSASILPTSHHSKIMGVLRLYRYTTLAGSSASAIRRHLSTRASRVLSALSLPTEGPIPGVYDGQWRGSGPIVESKCPATGEVIGRIRTVSRSQGLPHPVGNWLAILGQGYRVDSVGYSLRDSSCYSCFKRGFSCHSKNARTETRRSDTANPRSAR